MFRSIIFVVVVAYTVADVIPCFDRRIPFLDGRIVGGETTTIQAYPHQVSLRRGGSHICGGAITQPHIVITAAHCVQGMSASTLSVRAGSTYMHAGGTVLQVSRVISHPSYDSKTTNNDIAILILSGQFTFSTAIKPITLTTTPPAPGSSVTVTGWGTTKEGGFVSYVLQKVSINVVTADVCAKSYAPRPITSNMICAGIDVGGKDACQGDSGGPLIQGDRLVGIVSWGIGCARKGYPGVYSNVAAYKSWIESNSRKA